MDRQAFLSTFALVFVAELGDKTQLATLAMSAKTKSPWTVFVASSLALVIVALIGALAGGWIGERFSAREVRLASGLLLIASGVWILFTRSA